MHIWTNPLISLLIAVWRQTIKVIPMGSVILLFPVFYLFIFDTFAELIIFLEPVHLHIGIHYGFEAE